MKYINSFPGYEFKMLTDGKMHNMYRGVDVGKGGWVYSEPGIYSNVALLDLASMHPASIIALNKLGKYTPRYADLRKARVYIKHGDYEAAGELFDGRLKKYLTDKDSADGLSAALKLPLNSFFGISFASFPNPARDSRDKNNIIALRGALFMKTLFDEIADRGFKVIHNKTDSVKVPNATPEIIKFIQDFAIKYGYEMEHEGTYERICLIDDAQYIATFMEPGECEKRYGYIPSDNAKHFKKNNHPWTATGLQFQRPYVFKTLFSGEQVIFDDMCETKKVKGAAIYIDMNEKLPDVSEYEKELARRNEIDEAKIQAVGTKRKKKNELESVDISELEARISEGHDYHFVGRVGRFCPIKPGYGGGILTVLRDGKYNAVSGSKGYRWLESESIQSSGSEKDIDLDYFENLCTKSIEKIEKFGSFDRFIDLSRPYEDDRPKPKAVDISEVEDDEVPWNDLPPVVPCGDGKYNTCMECPHCRGDVCDNGYSLAVENGG